LNVIGLFVKYMKNILVIGGSGFIGSSLILALSKYYKIISIGRGNNQQILSSQVDKNVILINCDINKCGDLTDYVKNVDLVIHLGGGGGNHYFTQNPDAIGKSIKVTSAVIEACHLFNKKLIFTSTIAVYNSFAPRENPLKESMQPLPEDVYGILKLLSEYMIKDSGIDYIILRLPNIYGYSLKFTSGGVISKFIESAFTHGSIDIFTDGNNKMDYLFIDDLNRAFRMIIEGLPKKEVINLGSGKLFSLKEIAEEISFIFLTEYGKKIKINILNRESNVYSDRLLCNEKAQRLLGWSPRVSLKEGLRKTIRDFINDRIHTPA